LITLFVGGGYFHMPFLYVVAVEVVISAIYVWFAIGWLRRFRVWQIQQRPKNPPKNNSEEKWWSSV
jgi:hypothetical protein